MENFQNTLCLFPDKDLSDRSFKRQISEQVAINVLEQRNKFFTLENDKN